MHPHEAAVHFDRISPSWEVERALALIEFNQHLALHVVDVGTLDHLGGRAGAAKDQRRLPSKTARPALLYAKPALK